MEEETGEIQVQAKECQELPAGSRIQERNRRWSSSQGFRRSPNFATLWFWTSRLKPWGNPFPIALGYLVCDNLLGHPKEKEYSQLGDVP